MRFRVSRKLNKEVKPNKKYYKLFNGNPNNNEKKTGNVKYLPNENESSLNYPDN